MKKTNDPVLDEIHAIRRQINEETKDMTDEECAAFINQSCDAAIKECGYIKIYVDEKKTRFRLKRDPDNIEAMKKNDAILDEINEIRRQNGERKKDTACSEQTAYFKQSEPAAKKHGF